MSSPLWRKELRELRPWGLFGALFGLVDVVEALREHPDQSPLSESFGLVLGDITVVTWLLGLAVGMGLAVRERDDRTVEFLHGLPVSLSRVYFTKFAVAVAMVLVGPLLHVALAVVLHGLSRGSLDHALRVDVLAQAVALTVLLVVNGVALGAAVGGLRSLAWLATGALGVGVGVLVDSVPRAALLNPLTLAEGRLTSLGVEVDVTAVAAQLAIALVCVVISWRVFVGGRGAKLATLSQRPVLGAVAGALTLLAVGGAVVVLGPSKHEPEATGVTFAVSPPAITQTAHYRLSYPAAHSAQALALAAKADAVFEQVHALLHTPLGDPIDVDLSGSARNTAGTAFFGGIRLELGDDLEHVLAHETCHVVAQRLAGGERAQLWKEATILNEGLATWVERHVKADSALLADGRFVLATLTERRQLPAQALADLSLLGELDDALKYPVGEGIISAVVEQAGEAALPTLLKAFDDEQLPAELRGLELWRVVFQNSGVDLAAVLDSFYRGLAAEARGRPADERALPRPRVRLVKRGEHLGAQLLLDGALTPGWGLALRFKPADDSPYARYERYQTRADGVVWRAAKQLRGRRVCVQAGLTTPHHQALFEPWACVSVDEAQPLPAWEAVVHARLLALDDSPIARPSHVAQPHEGVFGDGVDWQRLDALSARWSGLPEATTCFAELLAGRAVQQASCRAVLDEAREATAALLHSTEGTFAGRAGPLDWRRRGSAGAMTARGVRLAPHVLVQQGAEALAAGAATQALRDCATGLALTRDVEWAGDAVAVATANALTSTVTPLCLRAAVQASSDELRAFEPTLRALRAGLAPLTTLVQAQRLAAEAEVFGPFVTRADLPEPTRAYLERLSGDRSTADLVWEPASAYFDEVLAAVPLPKADRDARLASWADELDEVPALLVDDTFRAHDCRLGFLAMVDWVVAKRLGLPAVTAETLWVVDEQTLEVRCSGRRVYRAQLTPGGVTWLRQVPP